MTEAHFQMLADAYERERVGLKEQIYMLSAVIAVHEYLAPSVERFIRQVKKSPTLKANAPIIVKDMIKAIYSDENK